MEPSAKDKYIILGSAGSVIPLIPSIATPTIAEKSNQDNSVRLIVFVCGNLLGWLLYFSFQTVIFDTYKIYKIKFGKKKTLAETMKGREELPRSTLEPTATLKPMPANRETLAGAEPPIKPSIAPELHKKNRTDYEDREQQKEEERVRMIMKYIRFHMPRITDGETVNHTYKEMDNWMSLYTYEPKPITRRLTKEITNIPFRHFVRNISECFIYEKYYNENNCACFIKALFSHEFVDMDITTIKSFKVELLRTLIPIDEPKSGNLDFHYPAGYVWEKQT